MYEIARQILQQQVREIREAAEILRDNGCDTTAIILSIEEMEEILASHGLTETTNKS